MGFSGTTWSDTALEIVRDRAAAGCSSGAIVEALGEAGYAVTRNAVIGVCHRKGIGLTGNSAGARSKRAADKRATQPRPRKVRPPRRPAVLNGTVISQLLLTKATSEHPVPITQLTSQTCRWPLGGFADRPPFLFCGDPPVEGCPYCARHYWQSTKETNHATFRATEAAA